MILKFMVATVCGKLSFKVWICSWKIFLHSLKRFFYVIPQMFKCILVRRLRGSLYHADIIVLKPLLSYSYLMSWVIYANFLPKYQCNTQHFSLAYKTLICDFVKNYSAIKVQFKVQRVI